MRAIIRSVFFSFLALSFISSYFSGISFDGEHDKMVVVLSLGLGLVYLLVRPLLKLISLPSEGFGFVILLFLVSLGAFFILDRSLGGFSIGSGNLTGLNILGIVIRSYNLTVFWSYCLTAGLYTLSMAFFDWLVTKRR